MDEDKELIEALLQDISGDSSSFRLPSCLDDLSSGSALQPSPALEEELEWETNKDVFPTHDTFLSDSNKNPGVDAAAASAATRAELCRRTKAALPKQWRCSHRGVKKTPGRRAGPEGPGTLCNACGIRFRSGGLVPEYRPANSPTFSKELHSNRNSIVTKMREESRSSSKENSFTK